MWHTHTHTLAGWRTDWLTEWPQLMLTPKRTPLKLTIGRNANSAPTMVLAHLGQWRRKHTEVLLLPLASGLCCWIVVVVGVLLASSLFIIRQCPCLYDDASRQARRQASTDVAPTMATSMHKTTMYLACQATTFSSTHSLNYHSETLNNWDCLWVITAYSLTHSHSAVAIWSLERTIT